MPKSDSKTTFLIHVHVFYTEMWAALSELLRNTNNHSREIWITLGEDKAFLEHEIKQDFPDARILYVENRGYDIGPFVEVLKQVDVCNYQYCIKLHTKRDIAEQSRIGYIDVSGAKWRQYLLSFMQKNNFEKVLQAFSNNPKLGMVGHHALCCKKEYTDKHAWEQSRKWLCEYGLLSNNAAAKLSYIAGSMFMCRAALLTPVKEILSKMEFEIPSRDNPSTISHWAERLMGHAITAAGYELADTYTCRQSRFHTCASSLLKFFRFLIIRFFYQKKITRHGKTVIKICKVPVYHAMRDSKPD